jgi:hypothetical protein
MWGILQGEFFWGIVVGLALSFFGAWLLAKFTVSLQQKHQKKVVVEFCIDEVRNLQSLIQEMDATRDRTKAIFHDFLALIDAEVGVYGRNRENLLHLPQSTRDKVRRFMNECAVKRAEVASHLDQFYQLNNRANQAQGIGGDAAQLKAQAEAALQNAHRAADRLVTIANGAPELVRELNNLS